MHVLPTFTFYGFRYIEVTASDDIEISNLVGAVVGLYPFLAPNRPADSPLMVIEGWLADAPLEEALAWADAHNVTTLYLTGGPIETGSWLAPWKTYPEMTAARLEAIGAADRYQIRTFPAPRTRKDRTWLSAVTLRPPAPPRASVLRGGGPSTNTLLCTQFISLCPRLAQHGCPADSYRPSHPLL